MNKKLHFPHNTLKYRQYAAIFFYVILIASSCNGTSKEIRTVKKTVEPRDLNWHTHLALDPRVVIDGRTLIKEDGQVSFEYSGVTIHFALEGTAAKAVLKEEGLGTKSTTNYFAVLVDGVESKVFALQPGEQEYVLFDGLEDTLHQVELIKRTEANVGRVTFKSVAVLGDLVEPHLSNRVIEFIGNSITCGYGNDTTVAAPPKGNPTTGFHSRNEDVTAAFSMLTARKLKARAWLVSYSGKGVWRNYGGGLDETIPKIYHRTFPHYDKPAWDYERMSPNAIVVNLGTNDFANAPSLPMDYERLKASYKAFVLKLRSLHASSSIFLVSGGMMNDVYPAHEKHLSRFKEVIDQIIAECEAQGVTNIFHAALPSVSGAYGEDWHPDKKGHQLMADSLSHIIGDKLSWE